MLLYYLEYSEPALLVYLYSPLPLRAGAFVSMRGIYHPYSGALLYQLSPVHGVQLNSFVERLLTYIIKDLKLHRWTQSG